MGTDRPSPDYANARFILLVRSPLEPGTYSVQVEMAGFAPRKQDNIDVNVSHTFVADFKMKVGGLSESLDVVGEAPTRRAVVHWPRAARCDGASTTPAAGSHQRRQSRRGHGDCAFRAGACSLNARS